MSLSSTTNRNDYVGNGATATYAYGFKVYLSSELRVTVVNTAGVETRLTINTDYTVTGVGSSSGGNIVLVNASQAWLTSGFLTTGYGLTVRRVRALTQLADIRNQGEFYPETHEDVFDKMVMNQQQLQDELDRAVRLPETEAGSADFVLPTIDSRANQLLGFDADGDPIAAAAVSATVSSFMQTVLDDTTAGAARTTLGHAHTTAGDIEYASSATELARLAAGTAGKVLKQGASVPAWAYPHSRVTKVFADSPYTVLSTDTHIDVDTSGGAVTITVPAASSTNAGQTVVIRKTTSDFNAVTLQTGVSTTLNTLNESVEINAIAASWAIIQRTIPSTWTSYTPTFSAGFGASVTNISAAWMRRGNRIVCRGTATAGTVAASYMGITIPSGLVHAYAVATIEIGGFISSYTGFSGGTTPLINPARTTEASWSNNTSRNGLAELNGSTAMINTSDFSWIFEMTISGWNG